MIEKYFTWLFYADFIIPLVIIGAVFLFWAVCRLAVLIARGWEKRQKRLADKHYEENIAKFFHKGDKICVSGELQSNEYTDRDGNRRESKQIIIDRFDFCESSRNSRQDDWQQAPRQSEWQQAPIDEDLPFN